MHEPVLLKNLLIVGGVSLLCVYALHRVRLPTVVGFLLSGVIIGPGLLGLIDDRDSIEAMAEIGVVLLLFTIGLKFSLRELLRMRTLVVGAGGLQITVTALAVMALARLGGLSLPQGLFLGFLLALSSTAMVLKLLEDRGEPDTAHGRVVIGVLLMQDLAIVPLMLLVPSLAPEQSGQWWQAMLLLLRSFAMVALIVVGAHLLYGRLLALAVAARNPEVLALSVVFIVLGTAYVSELAGLPLALGAFLAGIVVSESDYAQHILAHTVPFRDTFSGLFFVSVGMLMEPALWLREPLLLAAGVLGVVVLKSALAGAVALLFRASGRVAVLAGLSLAQIGEFSFLLAQAGLSVGLIDQLLYQRFLAVTVATMALTPLWVALSPRLAARATRMPLRAGPLAPHHETEGDHVIIVGYGVNGQSVSRVLRRLQAPYVIIEMNPQTVRSVRAQGERAIYGDACREGILRYAGVVRARVLVVAIADPAAGRRITAVARHLNPALHIIVRTRFVTEIEPLRKLGADVVVPEEFETALRLVSLVMAAFGADAEAIERETEAVRCANYALLQQPAPSASCSLAEMLSEGDDSSAGNDPSPTT